MIDKNRKKSIDDLVSELKSEYDTKNLEGLRQLSKDKEINVIESNKLILSFADEINEKKYIFLGKTLFKKRKLINFTHEIGHHLLNHPMKEEYGINEIEKYETEAIYFQEQLYNKELNVMNLYVDAFYKIMTRPLDCLKYSFLKSFPESHAKKIIKN